MPPANPQWRVLAGRSRSRLLAVLRRSRAPLDVRHLAKAVGLHPNTAREHLRQLIDAGLVVARRASPDGRGRPGLRYAARLPANEGDREAAQALAGMLADVLSRHPDREEAARKAGVRWGEARAGGERPVPTRATALTRLLDLLTRSGFAPERPAAGQDAISLFRCPFGPVARAHPEIVCNIHLGLMQGALRHWKAPLDTVAVEPYVDATHCLAHLK